MTLEQDISLQSYNTFGIDVRAAQLFEVFSEGDLLLFFQKNKQKPIILGGGSNILFTQNVQQPLLKVSIPGIDILEEDEHSTLLQVGAGVVWHDLVMYAIDHHFPGFENLSLIPGTVGAAPIQNIGAYGIECKSLIHKVRYLDIEEQVFREIQNPDCAFGYRDSIFKNSLKGKVVISKVFFRVNKKATLSVSYGSILDELRVPQEQACIRDVSEAVVRIRRSKLPDPAEIGNAGSFFKNPIVTHSFFETLKEHYPDMPHFVQDDGIKIPAAWLIETAGWKGFRRGNYGVHTRQALVLVNYGGATGAEILALSEEIIHSVKQKFGIDIEREVQIV